MLRWRERERGSERKESERETDIAIARDTDMAIARDADIAVARDTDIAVARDTDIAVPIARDRQTDKTQAHREDDRD
jgi:urease accessory protein UreE